MTAHPVELRLLATAGRLLLEYNDSTGEIENTLAATSRAISSEPFAMTVSYGGVAVSLGDGPPLLVRVHELRYNATVQAQIHSILDKLCRREFDPTTAFAELELVEARSVRHSRWINVPAIGFAAAALATLLGADFVAVAGAGIATALGLVARQDLAKRHFSLLMLPFIAALIGAVVGALAIRCGWTRTPGLIVIVPALMIVPGPHLINGLIDLVDNYISMSLARLSLAAGILLASAAGTVIGMAAVLPPETVVPSKPNIGHLNLLSDMVLAGVVTFGFAAFYNVALSHVGLAIVGGAIGHGLRYVALDYGWRLAAATFVGSLAVGIVSAIISRSHKVPVAVVAFAGAVTMMPGIQIYRALRGFLQLAHDGTNLETAAATLGDASQAILIVGALALGLVVAIRGIELLPTGAVDP